MPWWTCGEARCASPDRNERNIAEAKRRSRSSGASTNRAGELFASGVLRMCGRDRVAFDEEKAVVLMGRDRLVDQIAQAMARAENASEDHFEAYRHVAEAVAAVVEPLLAEKDKAAVEVVERLLRATMDNRTRAICISQAQRRGSSLRAGRQVKLAQPGLCQVKRPISALTVTAMA